MKKLGTLLLMVLFAVSVSACATSRPPEKTHVKCPACGYEFEVPGNGSQ